MHSEMLLKETSQTVKLKWYVRSRTLPVLEFGMVPNKIRKACGGDCACAGLAD